MEILVDGKVAAVKGGSSFDYNAENRLFSGRDGYTLAITFPLRGCPENLRIFGHLNRMDVAKDLVSFECAITDKGVSLFGVLSVVKISESEVEGQFAEGRCAQTVEDPLAETMISDLDLGSPPSSAPSDIVPADAWKGIDEGADEVALPWVNENAPTAPNNWVDYAGGAYSWNGEVSALSWQPYLIVIARRICEAVGYDCDFSEWEDSVYRHLIVCNSLPSSWEERQYARAMPEWSVSEFFGKLELLLMCEFDFDHRAKTVSMRFSRSVLDEVEPVKIDEVVEAYSVDVSRDDVSCDYIASRRIAYKECSHSMQPYYSCDWYVSGDKVVKRYDTLQDLIERNRLRPDASRDRWGEAMGEGFNSFVSRTRTTEHLLYAADVDTHFVFRSIGTEKIGVHAGKDYYDQVYVLQPVNVFGSGCRESDDRETEDIEFVPVCVADTYVDATDDRGTMMFLTPSGDASASDVSVSTRPGGGNLQGTDSPEVRQPGPANAIEEGERSKSERCYDEIFVGFWDGTVPENGMPPYPIIDVVTVTQSWSRIIRPGYSLRLYGSSAGSASLISGLPSLDPAQKFKFSWLSDSIPDPRAVFHIGGQRYICEKITATFTESGMSQLLKGEFYPLLN